MPSASCAWISTCVACLCLRAFGGRCFSCVFASLHPSPVVVSFRFFFFFSTDLFSVTGAQGVGVGGGGARGLGQTDGQTCAGREGH